MRIVVLLSAGIHPVSRRPVLPPLEAQAIALARLLCDDVVGLHAGDDASAVSTALGQGLAILRHIKVPANVDVVESLADELRVLEPDLILAGRRSGGPDETGLVPYLLARQLGREIVADAVAATAEDGALLVDQALPRGVRRRIRVACPALVTVHPAAPAARAYAFGEERRGTIVRLEGSANPASRARLEERPARPRPKLIGGATGGAAADRLRAATETAKADGQILVDPAPVEAARAILMHLRSIGVLPPPQADSHPSDIETQ